MPKSPRITAALERCARSVKDSDEFVEHIAHIAAQYRREHALDGAARAGELRKALREFAKHAEALSDWLKQAHQLSATTERAALERIAGALRAAPDLLQVESKPVLEWLLQANVAAGRCLNDANLLPRKLLPAAPRLAAEALRATFEHHKLKWSVAVTKQTQGDAVRLFCAIAKGAGDTRMDPRMAQAALRESGK